MNSMSRPARTLPASASREVPDSVGGRSRQPWPVRFTLGAERPDPASTRQRLTRLTRELWANVRLLCASSLDVPDFEFKLVAGEAIATLTEVAASVEERLAELGGTPQRTLDPPTAHRLTQTLRLPPDRRLPVLATAWLSALAETLATLPCDPLLDGPTERVRRRAARDVDDVLEWFRTAGLVDPTAVPGWLPEDGTASDEQRAQGPSRPAMGVRDDRFTTFDDTRDYRKADDWAGTGSAYDDDLIELLRINRDEIDALETFALALYDLVEEAPLEVLRHLARLAWDEARHAATGHALLLARGDDPYAYQCSMIGIRVRGAMQGWAAWTQITLFGELGIIGPMRQLERAARDRGDTLTATAFGFICRDETMHLKDSRRLLDAYHPAGGLEAAEAVTRAQAGALLERFGILSEEQYQALDARQIFELLGE